MDITWQVVLRAGIRAAMAVVTTVTTEEAGEVKVTGEDMVVAGQAAWVAYWAWEEEDETTEIGQYEKNIREKPGQRG